MINTKTRVAQRQRIQNKNEHPGLCNQPLQYNEYLSMQREIFIFYEVEILI
jgi:hypothetical protein